MSTLKVTDIQSNGTGFNDVVSFKNASGTENGTLCRAWVNFDGTGTIAISDSFNVSSMTDGGTGIYTVNFTNAMPDTNYAIVLTSTQFFTLQAGTPAPTTNGFMMRTYLSREPVAYVDAQRAFAAVFN